jgi:hypothetical protein
LKILWTGFITRGPQDGSIHSGPLSSKGGALDGAHVPGGSGHEGSLRRHQERGGGAPVVLTTTSKGGGTTRPGRATTMNTDGGMSFDKRAFRAQREPAGYQDGRSGERT